MNSCIGLFDSGVGGLTVLRQIVERHGDVSCVYLGDLARVPYGSKSKNEIREIAYEVVNWLKFQNISSIVIACNTTNSLALDIVKEQSRVPVFDLIDAGIKMIEKNRVGVLCTPATANSMTYSTRINRINSDIFVLEKACPAFVPLIETFQVNSRESQMFAEEYLHPLLEANVEEIILGCSHYPFLKPLLMKILPQNVRLIDPALGMAKYLDRLVGMKINKSQTTDNCTFDNTRFCVTADASGFASRAMHWLKIYPEVEVVSLRSKACVS